VLDELKKFVSKNESDLTLSLGIILISLISFAAGRLAAPGPEKQPITIERVTSSASANSAFQNIISGEETQVLEGRTSGLYVGSKNSDKYHLPDCSGAKRIAEHNKIWFNSKEEAEGLGYKPAANCEGL